MAVSMGELTEEIRKVVTAPYTVCLKPLHNVLRKTRRASIDEWALNHEDEIPQLSAIVVQGLALWPYALDIVDHLVHVPAIRDAILHESPGLLNHLLEKVTSDAEESSLLVSICVSILSEALPIGMPLPAAAQSFLSFLFERAAIRPSVSSIEPVYLLIDGACGDLLELIPQTSLDTLRDQLTQMMRTAKKIEEQPLSLYCLAITAKLNKFHHAIGTHAGKRSSVQFTPSSQRRSDTSSHSWEEVQKFFTGDRALKTIHLLVLQVIYACRSDGKGADEEGAKNVRIAREVLSAIEVPTRSKWVCSNAPIVKKLHEKIGQASLDHALQLEGLAFSAMLHMHTVSMPVVGSLLIETLSNLDGYHAHLRYTQEALSMALPSVASELNSDFWISVLSRMCDVTSTSNENRRKRAAIYLLTQLVPIVRTSLSARQASKAALDDTRLQGKVREVLCFHSDHPQRLDNIESKWTMKLIIELCCFVLAAAAWDREEPYSPERIDVLATVKLKQITTDAVVAHKLQPWAMPPVSLMEQTCTPEEQAASHNWQQRLAMELNFDSRHRQESITRLIGQICRDLQERCNEVEKPLRAQEAKYEDLRNEFVKLHSQAQEMQNQLVCQATEMEALERSKLQVQEDLESALAECDKATQDKASMQHALQQDRTRDAQTFEITKRKLEADNLEMRTTLACNEERLDEQAREIAHLKQQLAQISECREKEGRQFLDEKAAYENSFSALEQRRHEAEDTISQQQTRLTHMEGANAKLSTTIESLRAEMVAYQASAVQDIAIAVSARDSLQQNIDMLRREHSAALDNAKDTLATVRQEGIEKLGIAESHYGDLQKQMADEIHNRDSTIEELRRKAQRYADEYQKQAAQLEEAQRMRTRLMMAMGLDTNMIDPRATQEEGRKNRRQSTRNNKSFVPSTRLDMDVTFSDNDLNDGPDQDILDDSDNDKDSETAFGSPLASIGVHQQAAPPLQSRPQQRTRIAAFKVPTMRPPADTPRTLRSPPRRRQTHNFQPLSDVSGELGNQDLGRSPRRVQSEAAKLGELELNSKTADENSRCIMFD